MKIIVTTDSTSDLPNNILERECIETMPLFVNLEECEYQDGKDISIEEIFAFVKKTGKLPKTAARSTYSYKELFESALKKYSADAIIHISLSAEFSCSYANAKNAAEELGSVYVLDSRSLSSGCGLLVLSACDKIREGKDIKVILEELNNEIPKIQASFIINDLSYLYKGGRCSSIAVFGANILRIKPKIKLLNGKMDVDKKYIGKYETVILKYVEDLIEDYSEVDTTRAFITFTSNDDNLNNKIKELLTAAGFKEIIVNFAGSTVASHCGENCLGVLFISKKDIN